ncbi:DEHA2G23760p [Debaryomyces hansenii CBS767]|uniref:DEHA2G23760p n=1 Tax=Debaryomyces hansenii (strain ATCC 36239 / CBS 767 / BCRC 21394 / JCM 1990 / NBRC 0083 / IGC 2968) TaxID=284592 RepID=Q6BGU9_DEBHA|nr:DEHA2G23760p [Debaryomyces hansenii CBS767]CAG91085.2 DEHA2G23760p [Debaryomyces hansenii CBS767]|eukprot:XP_462572.2 DEHA2G23760p [Debaryomyces hansenii CBS767]
MVAGVIGDDTLNQINRFRLQESTEVPETTIQNEVLQYEEEHEISLSGRSTLLGKLPYSLIMKVSASEPRDVLQSERTLLSFIRFATSLFFTALGIVINFKLDSSGKSGNNKKRPPFNSSTYSTVASFVLFGLSLCVLIISGVNYFITIQRYAKHKIETYNFNNIATVICMTCIIITLIAISISLIIEGYLDESI